QVFYLDARKAALHNALRDSEKFRYPPTSREEYYKDRSAKIDAIISIIQYHQQESGRPPLKVKSPPEPNSSEVNTFEPMSWTDFPPHKLVPPKTDDKIVMFIAFPEHNPFLNAIFRLWGIETMEIHGGKTPKMRAKTLKAFREAKTAAVLLVSIVGIAGLNLDCANIMIIADLLWSKQDELQLIGRVWRRPQPKHVIVYRLIALGSPDQFLSDLSWGKGAMHNCFLEKSHPVLGESHRVLFILI
ncbi:P-loop containing nucleoside triphosphate hydrolase protein, partial [Irpex rosettiformis]